jgi:catechol 2,3-dioxygenase-like lactoylglutathione lyase family enzyme
MITGAHVILFSKNADADRAFFRDVLEYRFADAGHGWLIFALPPAELAFHPGEESSHELYLMCDDVNVFVADMKKRGVETSPLHEERWGTLTQITLPSGDKLGVYQPKHASPLALGSAARKKPDAKKSASRVKKKKSATGASKEKGQKQKKPTRGAAKKRRR